MFYSINHHINQSLKLLFDFHHHEICESKAIAYVIPKDPDNIACYDKISSNLNSFPPDTGYITSRLSKKNCQQHVFQSQIHMI